MLRNIWLAVYGTLLCGGVAMAQQPGPGAPAAMPIGNPGAYGYPGYGPPLPMGPMPGSPPPATSTSPSTSTSMVPPYGNNRPMMPMGPGGMMPYGNPGPMGMGVMNPYGNTLTGPIPPDPRRPLYLPNYDGAGPKQGAAEPYMVGPEKNPVAAQPPAAGPMRTLPQAPGSMPTPMMPGPYVEATSYAPPAPPAEPYALYEGARYQSDVKQDNVTAFGQVNYVHWWARRDQTPPLLTTGNAATPTAGTLGNADTVVLLGGGSIAPNEFSGVQANFGVWLDPERLTSMEFGGFYLGKNSRQYSFASDANGNNVIAQPVVAVFPGNTTYGEGALTIASPGLLAGSASYSSVMNMVGAEFNFGRNLLRYNGWTVDALAGFRYMYLNDTLTANENSTILPGFANAIAFLGNPLPAGANLAFNDSFNLTNRFYGGQIGARVDWVSSFKLDVGGTIKVALGDTNHAAVIDGTTTLTNGGATNTAPGGAYSQPSDIGHFSTNDFSVVTELTFTVGYQVHPNVRLTAGYNLIYWPRVERAGAQIDRTMDPGQSATDPAYNGSVGTYPRFLNTRSDFWAQGVNVGVEVKY